MSSSLRRALLTAFGLFLLLFALRLLAAPQPAEFGGQSMINFESGRRNYATTKVAPAAMAGVPLEHQKYEKIATLGQWTESFDADRARLLSVVATHEGLIQIERATGLSGRRTLALGIGVPPDRFDEVVKAAQAIGRSTLVDVVKNDKTNEYLQLKAKRATLEKSRTALQALANSGGSIDERVKVQNLLTEIEEKLQGLGVSLGEFDSQNELCTVKITLTERVIPKISMPARIAEALQWTVVWYAGAALGLLMATGAAWFALLLASAIKRAVKRD